MKNLIEELRACAKMHPLDIDLDVLLEAADALESQVREVERLGKYKRFESAYHEAERELAALKVNQNYKIRMPVRMYDEDDAESPEFARGHNTALDYVRRLNLPKENQRGSDE